MQERPTKEQMHEAIFMSLVFSFQAAAMQQMGKIKNPLTDKIERDLNQARNSIDMLGMLQAKTKGNLSENEEKLLERMLSELRLNYLDELNKDKKMAAEKPEEAKPDEEKKEQEKTDKAEPAKEEKQEDAGVEEKADEKKE